MQTIQIIKTEEEVKQPTKTEVLYYNAVKAQEAVKEAQKTLKESSIEGIKDLLHKLPNNNCNLMKHNIWIVLHTDEFGYNVFVSSVYLDNNELYIMDENELFRDTSFVDSNLLYAIYTSMYARYICNRL